MSADNQEHVWRGILDRVQSPEEPLPTFVAHMLGEFNKLRCPPPEHEQIELICKHSLEKYRVALYGTPVPSVMDLLLRAHELHTALGPVGRSTPTSSPSVASAREPHCFKCSRPGFTTRTCPSCTWVAPKDRGATRPRATSHRPLPGPPPGLEPADTEGLDSLPAARAASQQSGNPRGGRTFQ